MPARARISDAQRRSRIARRQAIAPACRVADVAAATTAMTVLHSTDASSVYLSALARVDDVTIADVDRALYADRSIAKQLAMRRTLFVFPRDLLPAALGSASRRVADAEQRRLAKLITVGGLDPDGPAWLERVAAEIVRHVDASPEPLTSRQIREQVPGAAGVVTVAPGSKWTRQAQVASELVTLLGMRGELVRAVPDGHWITSRPRWTTPSTWFGAPVERVTAAAGYAELVRRWLATFGPGTALDLQWWLGSTKTTVRQALADVAAVEVDLGGAESGWVLPDDQALDGGDPGEPEPWAALLPVLDPTTMGWKQRDFYLDPAHRPYLFDSVGNGLSTAWWNGRIVGGWVQDAAGRVELTLLEDVGRDGRAALQREADRLSDWLAGAVIRSPYAARQRAGQPLP